MINKDRIVPVQATDLISLYGVILKQNANNEDLKTLGVNGDKAGFFIVTNNDLVLCNEPVKTMMFAGTAGTVYFVADYDFEGFFDSEDAKLTPVSGSSEIDPDGCSLYMADYSNGTLLVLRIGLNVTSTGGGTQN